MKIKIIILIGVMLGLGVAYIFRGISKPEVKSEQTMRPTPTVTPTLTPIRMKSIFVPYWSEVSADSDFEQYDRLIYFGVHATKNGISEDEPGYLKLENFIESVKDKPQQKWLTIRMTNTEENLEMLNAIGSWDLIASSTASLATEYDFDGVVLDLELGALPSDGLRKRINEFVIRIHDRVKNANLPLALTIYGDTFYRKRPYDIEELAKNSEEIMIMAYDFHKSYGEAGPNFQLSGRQTYGYDFQYMIRDFLLFVPEKNITVIYGMYGYDWMVDEKKRPIKPATSLTLHEVRRKFLDTCEVKNCIVRRDEKAYESEVNYIDESANYHIVWFEDEISVNKKSEFMRGKGIDSIAYWAYGYF